MTIVFIGDIHQQWQLVERGLKSLDPLPKAAILLGDLQCDRPVGRSCAGNGGNGDRVERS